MQIRALLRTTTFRLSALYGLIFAFALVALPAALTPGGQPIEIGPTPMFPAPARLIARRLASGEVLVVGRDVGQLREMRAILASALIWSGGAVIAIGLACGVAFSLAPLRRLRTLQGACAE